MKINAYLTFNGNCEEAFKVYERVLRGKIEAMFPFEGTPASEHVPASHRNKIMHARLAVGDQVLMASDTTPDHPYEGIKGCSVSLNVTSTAEAERIFGELSERGTTIMPLQQTFWAVRFGMFVDRFGVPWMVNCEKES